jgi:hypothetical protein
VRDHVYADIHGADHASEFEFGSGGQFSAATIFEAVKVGSSWSGSDGSRINSGCACSCGAHTDEIS